MGTLNIQTPRGYKANRVTLALGWPTLVLALPHLPCKRSVSPGQLSYVMRDQLS